MPRGLSDAEIAAFRERLCDVAEQLFARHGPDGVTMRQLADTLGVSPMTPYRYFPRKDAILAAVRTRAFAAFAALLEEATAKERKKGPRGRPERAGMNAYLDFALAHPAAYRLMFDVSQPSFRDYPELVAAMERARQTLGQGLAELGSEGGFEGDAVIAGYAFWAAVHGVVMLQLGGLLQEPVDARAILSPMLAALAEHYRLRR